MSHPRNAPRDEAIATGQKFFVGVPCKLGHTRRYTRDYHCVECSIAKEKAVYNTPREREQRNARFRGYRSTPEGKAKTASQRLGFAMPPPPIDGKCKSCGEAVGWQNLHCDHNHTKNCFRDWVCQGCNTGVGIKDDPIKLRARADFLECRA